MQFLALNILLGIGLFCLGMYSMSWFIAGYIISNPEAKILADIREIKKKASEQNDNRNA